LLYNYCYKQFSKNKPYQNIIDEKYFMPIHLIEKINNRKLGFRATATKAPLLITLIITLLGSLHYSSFSVSQALVAPANDQDATLHALTDKLIDDASTEISILNIQRRYYYEAKKALDNNEIQHYLKLKQQLIGYPLLPYLEYKELSANLSKKPYQQIDQFLEEQKNSYLAEQLLKKWLRQLAQEKRWHEYRSYYDDSITSAAEQCLYIWSLLETGVPDAILKTKELWNVGKSQPSLCTPLFEAWKKKGYLTEALIWSRYQKTSRTKKNMRLIRYLKRNMSPESKLLATKYEETIRNPQQLKNIANYTNDHPFTKTIVHKGLLRYVNKNAKLTTELWGKYQKIFSFTAKQQQEFNFSLAKRKAFDYEPLAVQGLLTSLSSENQTTVIEIVLRKHLKNRQWQAFYSWLNLLPVAERLSNRWQYWQARYYQQSDDSKNLYLPIYQKLALTRGYYGFLSADLLDKPYSLQDTPSIINNETLVSLQQNKAVNRIKELYLTNKIHSARNEWIHTTKKFTKEQFLTLAQLTNQWGWYRKSIEAMTAATSWDDLAIRFPVAHQNIITEQAAMTSLPSNLIFAIARQESAWEKDARSSAGAMGLMQILPGPAKETAKKAGIKFKKADLLTPEKNIIIGSRYISSLLKRFENNRITAIAAYNAGPTRVNRWLKETEENLPHDIWIEVIPFGETRKYVQNVLSYTVVYGHQTGNAVPLLTEFERKKPL
jgi:soluble lytic murein transglycosylase